MSGRAVRAFDDNLELPTFELNFYEHDQTECQRRVQPDLQPRDSRGDEGD